MKAQALRKVHYEGHDWFFDERLSELRDCETPGCYIRLADYEVEYIKKQLNNSNINTIIEIEL